MQTFAYDLVGPAGAPLVLLLHGFMGSRRDWAPVQALLAPHFRLLAPDLPGHGGTGDPGDDSLWRMEGCANALAGLIGSLGPGPAAVAGYSLGGRLALHLAVQHPQRVFAAILLSASPGLADEAALASRREHDELLAARLEREGHGPFLEDWYRQPLFAALREHPRFPEVLARRRENAPRLLALSLRGMGLGNQRPLHDALPHLGIPLLILAGERDPKFRALALETATACPNANVTVIPGCGHALVEEDPAAVAREIARFLTCLPPRRVLP